MKGSGMSSSGSVTAPPRHAGPRNPWHPHCSLRERLRCSGIQSGTHRLASTTCLKDAGSVFGPPWHRLFSSVLCPRGAACCSQGAILRHRLSSRGGLLFPGGHLAASSVLAGRPVVTRGPSSCGIVCPRGAACCYQGAILRHCFPPQPFCGSDLAAIHGSFARGFCLQAEVRGRHTSG